MCARTNTDILRPPIWKSGMDYGDRMYMSNKAYEEQMRKLTAQAVTSNAGTFPESELNTPSEDTESYEEMEYFLPWPFEWTGETELYPLEQLKDLPPYVDVTDDDDDDEDEDKTHIVRVTRLGTCAYDGGVDWPYKNWTDVNLAVASNTAVAPTMDAYVYYNGFWYDISRGYGSFDLAGLSGTIASAKIIDTVKDADFVLHDTTVGDVITNTDYDALPIPLFPVIYLTADATQFEWEFNAAGLSYLQSKLDAKAYFCVREKDHDWDGVAPPDSSDSYSADLSINAELHITMV